MKNQLNEDIFYARMIEIVERREQASKKAPICPSCNSEQVQLIGWFKSPVQFKCRRCRHKFEVVINGN